MTSPRQIRVDYQDNPTIKQNKRVNRARKVVKLPTISELLRMRATRDAVCWNSHRGEANRFIWNTPLLPRRSHPATCPAATSTCTSESQASGCRSLPSWTTRTTDASWPPGRSSVGTTSGFTSTSTVAWRRSRAWWKKTCSTSPPATWSTCTGSTSAASTTWCPVSTRAWSPTFTATSASPGAWRCSTIDSEISRTRSGLCLSWWLVGSVPSKKILRWANVCFVAREAHATAQPCRHTTGEAFPTFKGICDIYRIKLAVRENENSTARIVWLYCIAIVHLGGNTVGWCQWITNRTVLAKLYVCLEKIILCSLQNFIYKRMMLLGYLKLFGQVWVSICAVSLTELCLRRSTRCLFFLNKNYS